MYIKIATIILLSFYSLKSYSQSPKNNSKKVNEEIDQTYTKLIKKSKVVGLSIAIVDNGEIVYEKGFGYADREKKIAATPTTNYRIASISKTFTALAVMQLHEKGLLDINKSIKEYIPELTIQSLFDDGNEVYIRDILSHISGLPSDIYNGHTGESSVPDNKWIIEQLNKGNTASKNRFMMSYSNVGYALLGELIQRVSGLTYIEYIKENIYQPLNMKTSNIGFPSNLSKGYVNKKQYKSPLIRDKAAGSLVSNVHEMANFLKMLLQDGKFNDNRLLSAKLIDEMETDKLKDIEIDFYKSYGYALFKNDIELKDKNGTTKARLIGHQGDTDAFHCEFSYIPELNVGAIVMTNTDNGEEIRDADDVLQLYLKETRGASFSFKYELTKRKDANPEDILGTYDLNASKMEVKNIDKIKFKIEGINAVLKKQENNIYSAKILLLGFIPIKMKRMAMKFVKIKDNIYLKALDKKYNRGEYMAIKSKEDISPNSWKSKFGKYRLINNFSDCKKCDGQDYTNNDIAIFFEKNGHLILEIKGKNSTVDEKLFLNIYSDKIAVVAGIGRGTGSTIKVLDNNNIYYSGFEFTKID